MKTLSSISSFFAYLRLVCDTRIILNLIFVFSNFNFPTLHAQDCFPDIEPPVLICKKIDTLMLGWCGNEQVYAWEFVNYTVDNCSKYVKITFDKEGKLEWIESFILSIGLDTSNNFITIYAHDDAGNVSECSSYCLPVSISNYKVLCKLQGDYNYAEELDKLQLGIRTQDTIIHPTTLISNSDPLDFRASISNINRLKSIVLNAVDLPFNYWFISTVDLIEASRIIINTSKYSSGMNYLSADTNCDGEINLLDLNKTYDYFLGKIDKDDCISKPLLKFINDSGLVLGNEISYELNQKSIPNIGFCQRGDINRETKYPYIQLINPISQIAGVPFYWKTKNQNLIKGQNYLVEFELSDSLNLFGLQGNFNFDPDLIQIDTFYSNLNSYFGSHRYSDDIQWIWLNLSNPKFEHQFPKISCQITAKADGMLRNAFITGNQSITNMVIDANGNSFPLEIEISAISSTNTSLKDALNFEVISKPGMDEVSIRVGSIPFEKVNLSMYHLDGSLFLQRVVHLQNGQLEELLHIPIPGFYFFQLSTKDEIISTGRFIKM